MDYRPIEFLRQNIRDVVRIVEGVAPIAPQSVERIEDRLYLDIPTLGISFVADLSGKIQSVFLHSAGHEGHTECSLPLPEGLSFTDSPEMARRRLGVPASSSGPVSFVQDVGKSSGWDRFARDTHFIHLQYGAHGIELVTVMTPDAVPH